MESNVRQTLLNKPARQLTFKLTRNKLSAMTPTRGAAVERKIWTGFNQGNTFLSSINKAWDGTAELLALVKQHKAVA